MAHYMRPEVCIISARRPEAVAEMQPVLDGLSPTWFVAKGDGDAYRDAGAPPNDVIESGPLTPSRNRALEYAFTQGRDCLQLSDDCTGFEWTETKVRAGCQPIGLRMVAMKLARAAYAYNAYLAGAMPTANPFYASPGRVQEKHFIVGDTMLIRRGTPLRFDERLTLKEDYDYTAQHIKFHGRVVRLGSLLASFRHGTNPGGAVAYRTPDLEDETIAYLMQRWPNAIKPNPKRPHEVLFRWLDH